MWKDGRGGGVPGFMPNEAVSHFGLETFNAVEIPLVLNEQILPVSQ